MSISPEDWRAAGLVEPDELDPAAPQLTPEETADAEEYRPGAARPDLDDQAEEADVVEQAYELGDDDDERDGDTG